MLDVDVQLQVGDGGEDAHTDGTLQRTQSGIVGQLLMICCGAAATLHGLFIISIVIVVVVVVLGDSVD